MLIANRFYNSVLSRPQHKLKSPLLEFVNKLISNVKTENPDDKKKSQILRCIPRSVRLSSNAPDLGWLLAQAMLLLGYFEKLEASHHRILEKGLAEIKARIKGFKVSDYRYVPQMLGHLSKVLERLRYYDYTAHKVFQHHDYVKLKGFIKEFIDMFPFEGSSTDETIGHLAKDIYDILFGNHSPSGFRESLYSYLNTYSKSINDIIFPLKEIDNIQLDIDDNTSKKTYVPISAEIVTAVFGEVIKNITTHAKGWVENQPQPTTLFEPATQYVVSVKIERRAIDTVVLTIKNTCNPQDYDTLVKAESTGISQIKIYLHDFGYKYEPRYEERRMVQEFQMTGVHKYEEENPSL